jgi:hypothetical protein
MSERVGLGWMAASLLLMGLAEILANSERDTIPTSKMVRFWWGEFITLYLVE